MGTSSAGADPTIPTDDPVRRRRAQVQRLVSLASRTGYAILAIGVVAFFVALATEFNGTMATIVIACLIVASFLLAPAIVLGYAVKAADREDRERGL
jgi:hypothetical protein